MSPEPTPDTFVWVSTLRAGIAYHAIDYTWRKTECGRYIGGDGTDVRHGYVFPLAELLERFGHHQPCKACEAGPPGDPPVVVPGRKSWTS